MKHQERQEKILLSLKKLDYLSTSQLRKLHDLGGERNARRVLDSMGSYLCKYRIENRENVFYLNKAGRERVGSDVVRQKLATVDHYLMRNDLFIYKKPEQFDTEMKLKIGDTTIIMDAFMKHQQAFYFVEIDNTQSMVKNSAKIEKYKKLKNTGAFQKKYGYFPRILWVTRSETRSKRIKECCGDLANIIYLWDDIN